MAQQALVADEIEAGRELLRLLDEAGFKIIAALWLLNEDSGRYRLLLASPEVDRKGKKHAYVRIAEILEQAPAAAEALLMRIVAVRTDEPLIRAVRRIVKTAADGIVGLRLTDNFVNGTHIPDAYVYRAA